MIAPLGSTVSVVVAVVLVVGLAGAYGLRDRYVVLLAGVVGSPLWWSFAPEGLSVVPGRVDGVTRVDVGPLGPDVSVRVVARAESPSGTVHVYAYSFESRPSAPLVVQDPVPGAAKSLTVAGPGEFAVVVDPGPSVSYRLRVEFDGYHGDPASGLRVAFPLTVVGTYRCPLGVPSACPP